MSRSFCDSPPSPIRATSARVRGLTGTRITTVISAGEGSVVTELCRRLEKGDLARFPLVWRVPADRLDHSLLRDRMQRFGDTVCPMGLTGAPNVRLHVSEIEAELAWAVSNIWRSGVRDTLRIDPPLVIPRAPDGARHETRAAYARSPVPTGLLIDADDGEWLRIAGQDRTGSSSGLPVLRPSSASSQTKATRRLLARDVRRRLRSAGREASSRSHAVVFLDLDAPDGEERAVATLAAMSESPAGGPAGTAWEIIAFDPAGRPAPAGPRDELRRWSAGAPPLPPSICEKAASLRRRRSSKINTRRLLELLAPEAPMDAPPDARLAAGTGVAPSAPGHERVLVASMMGDATISGTNIAARFAGGRLCGLAGAVDPEVPGEPTESLAVSADGQIMVATVESCVSFESESSRGLRSESVVTGSSLEPVARIRSDYSFVGDYDALVTTHRLLANGATPLDTLFACALPITDHRRCVVTGRYTDGTTYDHEVLWTETDALWGEAFQIWDGERRHTLVPVTSDGRPLLWSVAVLREPSRRLVIGGRYALGDRREHRISFLMMRAELDDRLVARALAGRVPAPIVDEIAAASVPEATSRQEVAGLATGSAARRRRPGA